MTFFFQIWSSNTWKGLQKLSLLAQKRQLCYKIIKKSNFEKRSGVYHYLLQASSSSYDESANYEFVPTFDFFLLEKSGFNESVETCDKNFKELDLIHLREPLWEILGLC